jgi:apolipoprotein N-acyltransferase
VLNFALALAAAVLLVLAFPPFSFAWLAPLALSPLLAALAREPRVKRRFLLGWAAGIVYWFGVCHWIQFVLAHYGGLGEVGGWAVFSLFPLVKGLHWAVFAALAGVLMRRWWAAPSVAALWVAIEVTHGPLGFAWLTLGNAAINMNLPLRLAPFTGVYGISFLFCLTAAVLALAILHRPRRELFWLAPLPLLALLPAMPPAQRGAHTALLVQPNISENEEWTAQSLERTIRRQISVSLASALSHQTEPPELVIWPEVPAPFYYFEDPQFRSYANNLARWTRAYLLIGIVAHGRSGAPLNSAQLVSPEGTPLTRYDKVNLVPFGEFVPWPFGSLATHISTETGDFEAGKQVIVSPISGGHTVGTFICYESVFPNFIRKFASLGAEVLINISNDGWFGESAAREQHLEIVRMRAVENRRWILRSTNDGISATIDSAGRLRGTLPPFAEATSYSGFNYVSSKTVYTRFGDWFAVLCALLALASLAAARFHPKA